MDYAAWTRRASIFLRSLTTLPGEIEINDGIKPPGTDAYTRDWLRSDKCSLPPELKTFVATASCRCCFNYCWKPPESLQVELGALLPGHPEVTGGADLCESARFHNYDNRGRFQHDLPLLLGEAASSDMESLLKSTGATDSERIQGRIALLSLPNGDRISLVDAAQGPRPVVFVPSTDSGKGRIISDSFDQFLSDWEQLCYITPSLTNLVPWLDPVSGRLNPHHGKAAQLREFLTTMASGKRGSP